jgi:glycerophosphoryl diester phosphodiesterase
MIIDSALQLAEKTLDSYFSFIPRKKPTACAAVKSKLIAHRGAHNKAKGIFENTMEAFVEAERLGCFGVELDVHATNDNVIVVNHDPTLERIWGHAVSINQLSFEALRALEPSIPTLEEVLNRFGNSMHWFIEVKTPFHAEDALFETLKNLTPSKDYHLLSLEEPFFASLQHFPKEALLLVPVHNNVASFCSLCLEKDYAGVLGNYLLLTDKKIQSLLNAGKDVGVGFVNSKFSLYRELSRNIPWIFSDNVEEVRSYLNELAPAKE